MTLFHDMAAGARAAHDYFFGGEVQVTEPGSAQYTVEAVLGKVRTVTRVDDDGRRQRITVRTCRFTALENLRHDAIIQADNAEWTIDEFTKMDASGLYVELRRIQTHSVDRNSYRGRPA